MYQAMTPEDMTTAIEAAVYSPETLGHMTLRAFRELFGEPSCAQWTVLFDFYGISKLGRLIPLGMDRTNVGRLPRRKLPTAVVIAKAVA